MQASGALPVVAPHIIPPAVIARCYRTNRYEVNQDIPELSL